MSAISPVFSASSPIRTILVTGVAGPAGRSLCRQLRRLKKGLRLIAVDSHEVSHCADIFLTGPEAGSPSLEPFLRSVIAEYDIDLIIPTVREQVPVIAALAPQLNTRALMPSLELAEICLDPSATALALQRHGLPVDGPAESPAIVGYCPQVYHSPVDDAVTTVLLQKMASTGLSNCSPDAVIRIGRSIAPDVAELAEAAVRVLGLYGPAHLDIRRDRKGNLRISRVHAAFGANSALAPELLTGLLADAAVPAVAPVG